MIDAFNGFIRSAQKDAERRAVAGWQCPECFGVRVTTLQDKHHGCTSYDRFTCDECGTQWSRQ